MKGGHKYVSSEGDQGVILVADQSAQRLSIRMLKNRSYITWRLLEGICQSHY